MKVVAARPRSIEGFAVGRVLPAPAQRAVGPFVFLDHMGPAELAPGGGMDVRPHPHIGLATVTYLFEGEVFHRDSIGSAQAIRPGAINWMTAGRGIAHSERTPAPLRATGTRLHGIQLWVGLPAAHEEDAPTFRHHPTLPTVDAGVPVRVLIGAAYGVTSPVATLSPMFYVDAPLAVDRVLPFPDDYEERGAYVVSGAVSVDGERVTTGQLAIVDGGTRTLRAEVPSRVVLLGGAVLDGVRHIWWNFVSSSKERIVDAAHEWRAGRFVKVKGDEVDYVPLPGEPVGIR